MYKNISLFISGFILFLTSCTEIIDLELNTEDDVRIVVEGGITTEMQQHFVRLSTTSSYFANQPVPPVHGATVTISDSQNIYALTEKDNTGYYYTDKVSGVVGESYTLDIKLQNNETYTATSTISTLNPIDSIVFSHLYDHPWYYETGYDVFLYVQEKQGRGDAYIFDLYIDNELQTDTLRKRTFVSDNEVDGEYIHDWNAFWINQDKLKQQTSEIKVKVASISIEYYDFIIALMFETDWRGGMYDGPPANIKGNISNGALGFFYASDIKTTRRMLEHIAEE